MSAGGSQILEEYLISLGYKTDWVSTKKFEESLSATGKKVFAVGSVVAGVIATLEATTAAFAYNMRQAYFAAELSGSTVKDMKAAAFAAEQFGVSSDAMASSIHGMAQALRLNPGLTGLLESLGVRVQGRDMSDVMLDTVRALKQMPEFEAAQFASMFGMDPDTYHQLSAHLDEILRKKREIKDLYKEMGVNPDDTKNLRHYAEELDRLKIKLEALGIAFTNWFAKPIEASIQALDKWMSRWDRLFTAKNSKQETQATAEVLMTLNPLTNVISTVKDLTDKAAPNKPGSPASLAARDATPYADIVEGAALDVKKAWQWLMSPMPGLDDKPVVGPNGSPAPSPVDAANAARLGVTNNTQVNNLTQHNTITVTAPSPETAAQRVANEQKRMWGDMARNSKGAAQ